MTAVKLLIELKTILRGQLMDGEKKSGLKQDIKIWFLTGAY